MKFKIFIFLLICCIGFGIIGGIVPEIKFFCSLICKICGVAEVLLVLYSVFVRFFGDKE